MANRIRKANTLPKYIWFIVSIVFLLLIGFFIFNKPVVAPAPTVSPVLQARTFTASDVMGGFTIEVPDGFTAEEKMGSVSIKSSIGEIIIGQNATNYLELEQFITDPRNNTKSKMKQIEYKVLNNLNAVSGLLNDEKIVYIYSHYNVYLLYTKNPQLYSVLDQIAQSFRIPK